MLTEKPASQIAANAPSSDMGSVTAGMMVARQSRRNRKMMATTISDGEHQRAADLSIAPLMKVASSLVTRISTPSGRICLEIRDGRANAVGNFQRVGGDWRMMPMPRPMRPLARSTDSPGIGAERHIGDVAETGSGR
jgi:hypothetical protein